MNDIDTRDAFAAELGAWLRGRFTIEWINTRAASNQTLMMMDAEGVVDLYFRLWQSRATSWPDGTLVIARIGFQEQHAGHGTALLKFLVEQASKHPFDKIAIEHTWPGEGIQRFCAKYFEPARPSIEATPTHWIASVSDLARKLAPHAAQLSL